MPHSAAFARPAFLCPFLMSAVESPSAAPPPRWHAALLAIVTARRAPSLAMHGLLAWPVALLPSAALLGLSCGLALALGVDVSGLMPPDRQATFKDFFGSVILAPPAETLLLGLLLWLLSRMSRRPLFIAAASGVLWGCAHGALAALWFFGTFWSFYVFSCAYLAWRPQGWGRAFAAAALPHALVNLTAMAVIFLDR